MNNITQLFKQKQNNILSVYFCAGHPHLDSTMPILRALQENNVDMAEIGIPFSDPMADGPVIQKAATTSLRNGMTLKKLFNQLQDVRKEIKMPLLLMGYLNVIMQYGFENFCQQCRQCVLCMMRSYEWGSKELIIPLRHPTVIPGWRKSSSVF